MADKAQPLAREDREPTRAGIAPVPSPDPDRASKAERKADKRRKREEKRVADASRELDAWERYRALLDALDEGHQLVELADRKARFALVIMGALNVVAFLLASRMEVVELVPAQYRSWLGVYVLAYASVAVYFFLQAIEALRPRRFKPRLEYPGPGGPEQYPAGIRYYEDVVLRDVEAHRRAWREVRVGQLSAEVAVQTHVLARINLDKYTALRRLYAGLRVMTLLAAGLMTFLALTALVQGAERLAPRLHGGKPKRGGLEILGAPQALETSGVREASGVAYDARSGDLFVVGDEGTLAQIDPAGKVVRQASIKGNLEDVAVHGPTGNLVLLSEKKAALVLYDPAGGAEKKRWLLDEAGLLGEQPLEKNQGFEGLAFREVPGKPGGGIFYLTHQRAPALVVAIAFDPEAAPGRLGAEAVVDRWRVEGYEDLTAATWVKSLDRLLVIADARDRILVLRPDGTVEAHVVLPGLQQEGLAIDGKGDLVVADDRGGLLRFPGALAALESALAERAAP